MSSSKFFSAILLAILYASYANAAPWPATARHPTHRVRSLGSRALKVETFHPTSIFKTFTEDSGQLQGRAFDDLTDLKGNSIAWITNQLNIPEDQVAWTSGFTKAATGGSSFAGSTVQYAFVKQNHNNISFANAVANLAMKDGKAVSFGSSFVNATSIADSTPTLSADDAKTAAEEFADGKANAQEIKLEYLAQSDGSVALAHVVQVQNADTGAFHEVFIDAHDGSLLSVTDFNADASYNVLPITKVTLDEGFETLTDPQDLIASPQGWHNDGTTQFTTTEGNNVVAFTGSDETAPIQQSAAGDNFLFTHDPTRDPDVGDNREIAVTNAFYLMNTIHDVTYRYGFTEQAFNFQENNFGNGGRGGDKVFMSVQDPSGTNNAAFSTPPDGQNGICQMFIWTLTTPNRDGSLENDIPIHEMMHGVTNRMTGGGTGRCLQSLESGGMGEGWSDALADWFQQKSETVTDFSMGTFVTNSAAGIRSAPYSTNSAVNGLTYGSIRQLAEVHNIGEVWANMLHNVYGALVSANGFSADAQTNPDATGGNVIFMHLLLDALLLQPCNPTFVQARDAILAADQARFNGANSCTVIKAFASRGLGLRAGPDFIDDTTVPTRCA